MAVKASILKRLVTQLRRNGMSEGAANATARKRLQEAGVLKKGIDILPALKGGDSQLRN